MKRTGTFLSRSQTGGQSLGLVAPELPGMLSSRGHGSP
jgi:hypothetical protein